MNGMSRRLLGDHCIRPGQPAPEIAHFNGPVLSQPGKIVTLTGSLTDQLGQPVAGRTVTFTLGTQTAMAVTNGSGVASTSLKLTQKSGSYHVSMSFAGDAFYRSSSSSTGFTIGK
jgi:hypothetical protein